MCSSPARIRMPHFATVVLLTAAPCSWLAECEAMPLARSDAAVIDVASVIANQQLGFVRNVGQFAADVRYVAATPGYRVSVDDSGVLLTLRAQGGDSRGTVDRQVRLAVCGEASSAPVIDEGRQVSAYHFLTQTSRSGAALTAPVLDRLNLRNVGPGVDLSLYGRGGRLEYDLAIGPSAPSGPLQLCFIGADSVAVDADGGLSIRIGRVELRQLPPVSFEVDASGRQTVARASFEPGPAKDSVLLNFERQSAGSTIFVDPVLEFGTYLGGGASELLGNITTDAAGDVYVAGGTNSVDFPVYLGYDSSGNGERVTPGQMSRLDAFVLKLDPRNQVIEWATFFGGNGEDVANAVAVTPAGEVVVAGTTYSSDLPTLNAAQPACPRCTMDGRFVSTGFVAKFSASGSQLIFSTYVGGGLTPGATDLGRGATIRDLALLPNGETWLAGGTSWSDVPVTATPEGRSCLSDAVAPAQDTLLVRLSPAGTVQQSVCLPTASGGAGTSYATSLARDSAGNLYVGGYSYPRGRLLVTRNAHQTIPVPTYYPVGFIAKLDPTGSALLQSTYVGGGAPGGWVLDIDVDNAGAVAAVGLTKSMDFPVVNAAQPAKRGNTDGFVLKLAPAGNSLLFSTYFGSTDTTLSPGTDFYQGLSETLSRVAVGTDGSVIATGTVAATDIPQLHPLQPIPPMPSVPAGMVASSRIMAEFSPTGVLAMSTYVGDWSLSDTVIQSGGLSLRAADGAVWSALTSAAFAMPVRNAIYWTRNGDTDVHVAKIDRRTQHRRAAAVRDLNGNGASEYVLLREVGVDGYGTVEVRDGRTGTQLNSFKALPLDVDARDVFEVPDRDADGVPEIAIAGIRRSDGRGLVQLRGALLPGVPSPALSNVWLEAGFSPYDTAILPDTDGNGIPEVAFLARRQSDDQAVLVVKNLTGASMTRQISLRSGGLSTGGDHGDSRRHGRRARRRRGAAGVRSRTGAAWPKSRCRLPLLIPERSGGRRTDTASHSIVPLPDKDGDDIAEIAVAASRRTDGRIAVETMNVSGSVRKTTVWFKAVTT